MKTMKTLIKKIMNRFGYNVYNMNIGVFEVEQLEKFEVPPNYVDRLAQLGIDKIHYGAGPNMFGDGWLNVDISPDCPDKTKEYVQGNLILKHPFPSNFFAFGFAQDFLEHLDQSESIIFLSESFRTLQPGGVLRLSFPGLKGVLQKHYRSSNYAGAVLGQTEAFTIHGHKHFYSEESLATVCHHIGFSSIEFVEYGKSKFNVLCNLDSRPGQQGLNVYVELTK